MSRKTLPILSLLFMFAPGSASAAVQITEIMYDVSGTDTGREWAEITNTGSSAVDVSGYKFFEANTNHALSLVQGSGVLPVGGSAIIADDDAKFKIDWPNYSGMLFDSTFSLSNSGEALTLKDGALNVLDAVTYDTSIGAAGDGNSLQRSGSVFVAAAPTPGTYGGSSGNTATVNDPVTSSATDTTQATQTQSQSQTSGGMGPPPITVRIVADARVMTGGGSYFSATSYGTEGAPLSGARFVWNFGDGTTGEGTKVFHVYQYPGHYVVSATAAYNFSSGTARATVEAADATVSLEAEGDGSLLVRNTSSKEINIGLWALHDGAQNYVIPQDTIMLAGEGIRFSSAVTGLQGSPNATLYYPNSAVAASASVSEDSPLRGQRVTAEDLNSAPVSEIPQAQKSVAPKNTTPAKGSSGMVLGTSTATTSSEQRDTPSPFWMSFGALCVVLGAGVVAVRYLQRPVGAETSPSEEEFDIE